MWANLLTQVCIGDLESRRLGCSRDAILGWAKIDNKIKTMAKLKVS